VVLIGTIVLERSMSHSAEVRLRIGDGTMIPVPSHVKQMACGVSPTAELVAALGGVALRPEQWTD
jgi:hypothetical protein